MHLAHPPAVLSSDEHDALRPELAVARLDRLETVLDQHGCISFRPRHRIDRHQHVDHGLGRQPRDRGAAVMLDLERGLGEHRANRRGLERELLGPSRVVRDDLDVVAHETRE